VKGPVSILAFSLGAGVAAAVWVFDRFRNGEPNPYQVGLMIGCLGVLFASWTSMGLSLRGAKRGGQDVTVAVLNGLRYAGIALGLQAVLLFISDVIGVMSSAVGYRVILLLLPVVFLVGHDLLARARR
jgi:hypothetical protein